MSSSPAAAYMAYVANSSGYSLAEFSLSSGGALSPLNGVTVGTSYQPFAIALRSDGKYAYARLWQ